MSQTVQKGSEDPGRGTAPPKGTESTETCPKWGPAHTDTELGKDWG